MCALGHEAGCETHDQPAPGRRVKAVEHLARVSSDHPAEADELLRRSLGSRVKERTFTRSRSKLPLGHSLRRYQRVPTHGGKKAAPHSPPGNAAGRKVLVHRLCAAGTARGSGCGSPFDGRHRTLCEAILEVAIASGLVEPAHRIRETSKPMSPQDLDSASGVFSSGDGLAIGDPFVTRAFSGERRPVTSTSGTVPVADAC